MSTPAALKLLSAALPREPSTPAGDGLGTAIRGRGGRGRGVNRGGGRHGHGGVRDEDVGMSDASEGGAVRRGRQTGRHSSGPMGDRPFMKVDGKPYNPREHGNINSSRNAPAKIRDEHTRSKSSPASSGSTTANGATSQSAVETLKVFLQSRYSPEIKMLNLEAMTSDTILKGAGLMAPGEKGAPTNLSAALWKLASQLYPDLVSISLATNGFTSLLPLSPYNLTSSFPALRNISLANNSLKKMRDLDPLSPTFAASRRDAKPKGFSNLVELVLSGNPLVGTGAGERKYRIEVAKRFPSLTTLDQQPLDQNIAFGAASTSDLTPGLNSNTKRDLAKATKAHKATVMFPVQITGGFCESEGMASFIGSFLTKFFPAFDTDRPSLVAAYAPICTFSYQIDTTPPARTRARRTATEKRLPNQHKLDWEPYMGGGRNMMRVKGIGKQLANLALTPDSVVERLLTMPKTIHPLNDAEKFVFDSWTVPALLAPTAAGVPGEMVMFASVHGEFMELPSKGTRSFDRTFILGGAPPGSPAQLAGWPCVILSDSLCMRGYTDPATWLPPPPPIEAAAPTAGPAPVAPQVVPGPAAPAQERLPGLTDPQHQLVLELQHATRLTYNYAHLCLDGNGWDPAVAYANFQALAAAGSLPPDAFVQ